ESEVTQCVTELIANDPIAAAVKAADKAGLFGDTGFTDAAEREADAMAESEPAPPPKVTQRVTSPAADAIFADSAEREEGERVVPIKMPTFTADDFAETMDIRNFATLVTLNTARWHAKVKDRQAAKDAAMMNEADE